MFRYAFRLKKGRDRDLIAWLENFGEGERSFYIRQALRAGIAAQGGPVAAQQAAPVIQQPVESPGKDEPEKQALTKEEAESKLNDLVNNF
jgi:hypothetical protein